MPGGVVRVSEPLVIPAGCRVVGNETRILAEPTMWGERRGIVEIAGDGISIDGLTIDGRFDPKDYDEESSWLCGIRSSMFVRSLSVNNCVVRNIPRQGIALWGGSRYVRLKENLIRDTSRAGIVLHSAERSIVTENDIAGTGDDAIAFVAESRECSATYNKGQDIGIHAGGQGSGIKIHGRHCIASFNIFRSVFTSLATVKESNDHRHALPFGNIITNNILGGLIFADNLDKKQLGIEIGAGSGHFVALNVCAGAGVMVSALDCVVFANQ